MDQGSRGRGGWFRHLMWERRPGRLSTREWLVRSVVFVVVVSAVNAVVSPLLGFGSWLHGALMGAAIAVTGACFIRAATKT